MFVVIEGLTGTGKSTVSDLLVDEFGFEKVAVKRPELRSALDAVENHQLALEVRHALFLSATLWCALEVEQMLADGCRVVADSWVYRTIATHEAMGSRLLTKIPSFLPTPTFTLLLELDEKVRAVRTAARGRPNGYWKQQCEAHSGKIMDWYRANVPNLRTISNTGDLTSLRDKLAKEIEEDSSD